LPKKAFGFFRQALLPPLKRGGIFAFQNETARNEKHSGNPFFCEKTHKNNEKTAPNSAAEGKKTLANAPGCAIMYLYRRVN
jgi:hypothetical protein